MIERIEDFILSGIGIPLTPWTLVNGEKLVPLLDRVRENLPDEIRQSQMIMNRRDDIIVESQRKGTQILEDAKAQAEAMLSESKLMEAVQQEAERIRQQVMTELDMHRKKAFEESESMKAAAYEEARMTREGADRYAEAILNTLGKNLHEFQTVVHNGQQHLSRTRAEASRMVSPLVGGTVYAPGSPQQPQKKGMPPQLNTHATPPPQQRGVAPTSYSRASQEYLKRRQEHQEKHRKLEV